jgi:hypothetical protein
MENYFPPVPDPPTCLPGDSDSGSNLFYESEEGENMSSSPMASGPLTRARVKEAVDYVIGMAFEFVPVDMHPIHNTLVVLTGKEDDLSIYKSWFELSESQINSLQYRGSNNKLFPLSQAYMTYVRQFQLMYLECQKDPTWNDSNIFALT